MKDARTILDNVRRKLPPDAKLLVVWVADPGGPMQCSQANLNLNEIALLADSLKANCVLAEKKIG